MIGVQLLIQGSLTQFNQFAVVPSNVMKLLALLVCACISVVSAGFFNETAHLIENLIERDSNETAGSTCAKPGDCGRAYQTCCIGFKAKGFPCGCHLVCCSSCLFVFVCPCCVVFLLFLCYASLCILCVIVCCRVLLCFVLCCAVLLS